MTISIGPLAVFAAIASLVSTSAFSAQVPTAREILGPTPLLAVPDEPPPKLIVDPPIPEQLALGRVFIQYRTENLRILPVYGAAAVSVSPRVGHMHIFVDDITWPIIDASGGTFVGVGMKPGPHKVVFQLADPQHRPFPGARETVTFVVPDVSAALGH